MVGVSILIGIATVYAKTNGSSMQTRSRKRSRVASRQRRSLSNWGLILTIGGLAIGLLLAWGGRQMATEFALKCVSGLYPVLG